MGEVGPVRVITQRYDVEDAHTLDGYERTGGYAGARQALEMRPEDVVQLLKDAGLRGRGGAGFPTGVKWGFMPADSKQPSYIVCNADEGEPGTFKDRELLERDPHALVEGMIIAGLALNAAAGFVYLRGEFAFAGRRVRDAVRAAYERGYLGADIFGSGRRFDLVLHRGAGAYEAGEETALLDSLEGRRAQPRLRPPFPAQHGLWGCPTTVNNVESLVNVPYIVTNGVDWYRQWGTEQSPGVKLMCIAGDVERAGNYEFALGTPVRDMIEHAGGVRDGGEVQFWCPGGSSTPFLTDEHLDMPFTFEDITEAGSLLGTGALMVYDQSRCIVDVSWRFTEFYEHESCGKCTPCREGTYWLAQVYRRLETGNGRMADLQVLDDIADSIFGRSFCALGDGATSPIKSSLKYFRDDYELHVKQGRCPKGVTPPDRAATRVLEPIGGTFGPYTTSEGA